jgi:hypothetical protein
MVNTNDVLLYMIKYIYECNYCKTYHLGVKT